MSDLFDRPQPDNPFAVDRDAARRGLAESNDFWNRQNREQQETNRRRQENLDRYTVRLTDEQYEILNLAIANAEIPEDEAYNMASAVKLSERYGIPLGYARQNLERYRDALFGTEKRYTPKDTFTAIADNWRIGVNGLSLGKLGNELSMAHEAGDPERAAALWEEIQRMRQENESLADHQNRNFFIEALKFGAQSAPFSGAVAGTAIVGSLLAPGAGTAAAFAASMALTRGQEYIDLLEAGAEPERARRTATAVGTIYAAIEMGLGDVASAAGGAVKLLGKKAVGPGSPAQALAEKLTADIFKKLHFSGTFKRAALRIPLGYAFGALEEGVEEVLQELTSAAALQAAASLQGEGVDAKTARELGEAVGEAFRGGLMGSLVLGLPGTFLNSAATIQDTNKLIAAAKTTPSDEAFRKDTAGNKLFEGMSDERREAAQDEIRARYEKHREQEEARIAADIKARGSQLAGLEERAFDKDGEETTPGVYRNPDGSLYTRIEDEKREGGVITGSFRMGDGSRATESNTYGAIDYRIENDALNITGVHVVDHRRELTEPFYQDFAKKFAGTDIRWEADAEADRELRDRLVRNNRRGPEAGLNYFENAAAAEDETYRIRLDRQIQEHARLGADEREAWIQLWEAAGERNGLGLRGTFERVYADPENIFSDTLEGARAAQAKGREIKGATFWRDTEKGLRAVVYVAKNGDFSTLSHESLHAYREALKGIDPGLSAEIDQALDSNVTREPWMSEQDYGRAREEYLVKNFENYLYNGAAPEPALKTLFDRIAAFMRRIYSYLSGKQAVSPEIQNVFDRIFAGYDARQGTARNGPNGLEMRNAEGPRRPAPTPPEGISERPGRDDIDVSGVPVIREQYQAAKKTYGRNGTINVNGERLRGRYVVAEAGTFASSHTRDFRQTPNFPRRADGSTVNDNDYENRPDAQESTLRQGSDFDQRGMGIVGTRDGIIVSGNGRNIAAQIAAARGTNTKYLEDLRDNSEGYGLTTADLAGYRNPELVFELEDGFDYSTESFAQFNVSTQKAASPMETAIKMAKRLAENPGIIQAIANTINEHETLSDLYNDRKAVQEIFNILQKNKITGEYERPQYADEQGQITGAGEDLLESVLLGAVLNERNIRRLRGAKAVRQKLVRGITALVENKAMGDYSLIPELHEAAGIALAVNATAGKDGKRIYGTVQDYVKQQILPGMPKGLTVEKRASIQLAEALESGGQKDFALWFGGLNASRAAAARGQAELFTGAVESKESILDRYAGYRDDLAERKRANRETLADPAAGPAAKAEAALDDAGIAGAEAAGTLLQTGDEANPAEALINRAGAMLEDPGEREQVIRELRELERLYPPETNRYLAPNGKPSLLLEALGEEQGRQAWYAVRTPSFKKWFGDWETAARIEEIEKSGPVKVTINAPVSQKEAEKIAASFGTLQNQSDGKATELPIATIGKIIYHQGFDVSRIIRDIPALYNTSIQGWTEQEIPKEGHKSHPNIQEYRHYINKFTDGTDEYYIRFTVTEEKTKPGKTGRNLIHSSAISEVSVYKNGDDSQRIRLKVPGEANSSPFIDKRLQQFFDSVNPSEVSQVRDANGEPKPVFHGTHATFDIFDRSKGDLNDAGWSGEGHYFYEDWSEATQYAKGRRGHVMAVFINVREPYYLSDEERAELVDRDDRDYSIEFTGQLRGDGYDGVYYNGDLRKEWTVFDSAQIKSATGNAGTYGNENPSILFQTCEELLDDAARYDTWREFRNAYEGQTKTENEQQQTAEWLLTAEPITTVGDNEIKITGKGKAFIDNIDGYFKAHWGNRVTRGDQVILLTREGIRSSLHHGYGRAKINAFAAVPYIIQDGRVIDSQNNWKNRGYDSYTVAAPFKIGDAVYIGEVIVNQHKDGTNTFHLHEVTEKSKLRGASRAGYETSTPEGASSKIIVKFLEKVKEENTGFHAPSDAGDAWYETFWRDARTARNPTLFSLGDESASPPERGDRAFLKDINRENLRDLLITLDEAVHARQAEPAAPETGEDRTAYDKDMAAYRNARDLKARINRELPHFGAWVGIAARVANGEELSTKDYNTLRGYLRDSPRDYRALFADLAGRPEWGLNLTEMKNGVPDTPLSAPRPERPDDMNVKNRERLAEAIEDADPELARGIRDGTIAYDDPRIRAFEQGLEAGIKKADAAVAAAEAAMAGDARKFKGAVQGRALELYREFKEAEEKYRARTTDLAKKIRRGEALAGRYQEEEARLRTDSETARAAFDAFADAENLRAEVREELARIDARHAERQRLRDLQKKRNAVREVKRIEESLIKRIIRKISLKTVAHDQAAAITIIQSLFEPSLIAGVNRRLGTAGGPALREIYMKWQTDADFREELRKQAGSGAAKTGDILGKPQWDYITNQEKRDLIRTLPKQDWIAKLNLKDLEQYREDLVPLDIRTSADGKAVPGTAEERIARDALGDELYSRIQNKPLEAWTMLELAELAEVVDDLYVEGRETLRTRNEARYIQYEKYRNKLSDLLRITKYRINPGDSPEEQRRKQAEIAKILGKYAAGDPGAAAAKLARRGWLERVFGGAYFDANIRRVARILDNGKEGTFTNLLYWQENDAFNLRERARMSRRLAAEDSMLKLGIGMPELFRQVTVKDLWGTGEDQVYTAEELLGMKLAARDGLSRRAVVYGNLAREGERSKARGGDLSLLERLADTAEARFAKVTAAADAFFAQAGNGKYLKFMEAIARDYDGVYDRLNRANIDVFNQPVWKVEHYFPMFRLEQTGGINEHQEIKDLLGLAGVTTQWTDNGMVQRRIEMGPQHQTGIELGLYTTWAKSLDRVEHFIAYAPYVRTLNMVFKSRDGKALMERIQDRYGAGMGTYIKEYINEKASPAADNNRHASDNIVKAMRGRTASAYLAWKLSGVLKQAVTSPWPYLQYMNPIEYAGACIRFYQNPRAMTDFIKEKSVFMATRSFDPVVKLIREQQELNRNKILGKLDQFNNLGMKGLEMVDWACVAPGWLVIYNREMARLRKANEGLAADRQLGMADMEYEAAAKADDIVRLTQPSGRDTDQAPMFKNTPQAMRAFLQFTQSLNVIWQNIRYDMPAAVREGQMLQAVGCLTGYILAGVSLGLLTEGLGGDDGDKKDDVAWQRQLLYYSFTQFTDAVPFIGDAVTKAWEGLATGRVRWSGGDNLFPVVKEFSGAAGAAIKTGRQLAEGDGEKARNAALKALEHLAAGFAYSLGLPRSGGKELLRALELDPREGDWEPGFNPEAFMGRK